ncbi:MAG: hypothetical protein ACRERD_30145 [Candidatus Binatia bacterium]
MARKINRRSFFILDQALDALDRVQDFTDRTTLKKYEDYQDYQDDKKKHEETVKHAQEEEAYAEAIREQIKVLGRQVAALLTVVEEIQKRQAAIDKLKMDRPF